MFTFSERHMTVSHYNDKRSQSTVTRLSFDNDQRHVTTFHSWSYDKQQMLYHVKERQ